MRGCEGEGATGIAEVPAYIVGHARHPNVRGPTAASGSRAWWSGVPGAAVQTTRRSVEPAATRFALGRDLAAGDPAT